MLDEDVVLARVSFEGQVGRAASRQDDPEPAVCLKRHEGSKANLASRSKHGAGFDKDDIRLVHGIGENAFGLH